jgi:hypothetical protein
MRRIVLVLMSSLATLACAPDAAPPRPAASAAPAAPASASPAAAAPAPAARPLAVLVELESRDASPAPLAREWAKELEAALAADPARFLLVKSPKEAELTVRIERVVTPPDRPGHQVMTLWLSLGQEPKRLTLDYTGGPTTMAGRLASFLVTHVEKARAGAAPSPPPRPETR